jgi:hypothetical protein
MDLRRLAHPLDRLAALQAGQLAGWQLRWLGLEERAVDRALNRLGWPRSLPGVVRAPGHDRGPTARAWAAVLATAPAARRRPTAGTDPVEGAHAAAVSGNGVTGLTLAHLHGLVPNAPTKAQLLLPHSARTWLREVHPIRTRLPLPPLELVGGVPSVPALRMLVDAAVLLQRSGAGVSEVRTLVSRADGRRLVDVAHLHEVVRDPRAAGLPLRLPTLLRLAAAGTAHGHSHSGTEARGRAIVREVAAELGLHAEPRPLPLPDPTRPVAEADIAITLLLLDIEVDGPHHDEPEQQRLDRIRDDRLLALGWTVRRYRAALVTEDEARFRRLVRADILQVAAARGIALRAA